MRLRVWALRLPLFVGSVVSGVEALAAQTPGGADPQTSWSPLTPIADLPRAADLGAAAGLGLFGPIPRVGAFWSGRNPAALPWEVGASWAELGLRSSRTNGDYHRPLDPGAFRVSGGSGFGWQPVREHGALAGRVTFDQLIFDPGTRATTLAPYSTVPFVVTDTSMAPNRMLKARLEGAAGWRIGQVGIGVAAGFQSVEGHSRAALIPRRHSAANPAATVGVVWAVPGNAISIGFHAREQRFVEISQIAAAGRATPQVTRLNGFATPEIAIFERGSYFRRREATARASGMSASGSLREWTLVGHGELGTLEDGQFNERVADPPTDKWSAASVEGGAAAQRMFERSRILVTAEGRWSRVHGDARLAGSDSVIFRAVESALSASFEARRSATASDAWSGLIRGSMMVQDRDRGDTLPNAIRTQIESLVLALEVEVARQVTPTFSLAAGAAQAYYTPRGSIPPASHYPASIRELAAGEVAFLATPHSRRSAALSAELRMNRATSVRLGTHYESIRDAARSVRVENSPQGSRSSWAFALAFTLRENSAPQHSIPETRNGAAR